MSRLPDRFDLWVRKARACSDPARQLDYVLGALLALPEWHFLNHGAAENPLPATTDLEGARVLLVFSDRARVLELAEQSGLTFPREAPPLISIPATSALAACLADGPLQCDALLVNPGDDAALIPIEQAKIFFEEWQARGERQASGYWIPSLTSEEEDFWQANGI